MLKKHSIGSNLPLSIRTNKGPALITPPDQLIDHDGNIRSLRLSSELASEISARYRLCMVGEDRLINSIGGIENNKSDLCYLTHPIYTAHLTGQTGRTVITSEALGSLLPPGNTTLLVDTCAKEAFYTIFSSMVENECYEKLQSYISPGAKIARSAIISENVYIEAGAQIMSGTIVMPNTYVGHDVVIKPNTTIGGDGFEVAPMGGRNRVVPHAGGVWLSDNVEIGSSCCIDKGLFGEFTFLGPGTKLDNLVQFAHSCYAGSNCCITACAELSGSVRLGEGVWVAPNTSIRNGITVGNYAYLGIGSVVTKNVPDFQLVYGSPAKQVGHCCSCRSRLKFLEEVAECEHCKGRYLLRGGNVVQLISNNII